MKPLREEKATNKTRQQRHSLQIPTRTEGGTAPRADAEARHRHIDWQPCPCAREEETGRRRRTDEGSGHARCLSWSMRSVLSVMCHAKVERMRQHRCSSAQEQASMLLWHGCSRDTRKSVRRLLGGLFAGALGRAGPGRVAGGGFRLARPQHGALHLHGAPGPRGAFAEPALQYAIER